MRELVARHQVEEYPKDVDRIVRVMAEQGYLVERHEAARIWHDVSDAMCAGWLTLPIRDEQIVRSVLSHSQEIQEEEGES